jgi:hypothetical protein
VEDVGNLIIEYTTHAEMCLESDISALFDGNLNRQRTASIEFIMLEPLETSRTPFRSTWSDR